MKAKLLLRTLAVAGVRHEATGNSKKAKVLAFALWALLFALCPQVEAQQPGKVPRIGLLSSAGSSLAPGSQIEAFRQGLRDLGYIEGQNLVIEYRYLHALCAPSPDLEAPLRLAAKPPLGALVTINNALVRRYSKRIADLAIKHRLPSMHEGRDYIAAGGLMSYSANETEAYSRAGRGWTE